MLLRSSMIAIVAGVLIVGTSLAQAPASAPAGATGMCKDGSYWTGATKKGACHGHKGIQIWYAAAAPAGGTPATAVAPAPAAEAAVAPAPAAPKVAAATPPVPAPGGGAGQVWVNTSSKVYHCPSDRFYGKTKNGAYMTEADAIAKGNRADHGKACGR